MDPKQPQHYTLRQHHGNNNTAEQGMMTEQPQARPATASF
jgi:hypothetical protein